MELSPYLAALKQLGSIVHEAVDVLAPAYSGKHFSVGARDIHVEDYLSFPCLSEQPQCFFVQIISVDIELKRCDTVIVVYDVFEDPVCPFAVVIEESVQENYPFSLLCEEVPKLRAHSSEAESSYPRIRKMLRINGSVRGPAYRFIIDCPFSCFESLVRERKRFHLDRRIVRIHYDLVILPVCESRYILKIEFVIKKRLEEIEQNALPLASDNVIHKRIRLHETACLKGYLHAAEYYRNARLGLFDHLGHPPYHVFIALVGMEVDYVVLPHRYALKDVSIEIILLIAFHLNVNRRVSDYAVEVFESEFCAGAL